jgi:hypothetical protein
MALNATVLGPALKTAVQSVADPINNSDEVFRKMAQAIIDHFISAGVVNTIVATTGTATAQSGTGVGGIS